ncbi:DUF480 domain-containing protein [Stutzerimonas nosocomialis]|nr:DUF480 domain-containing protein [Stutzerimonas nosocomialis]
MNLSDPGDTENSPQPLSATEARILGCLIEKQALSPETYPLTLNALVLACNQKTSREPVMNLSAGQVGQGLRTLEELGLVRMVMGSRADRWEHRAEKALQLTAPQVALIGLLLLRGPQTLNELLTRSSRMQPFDDLADVQHQLDRLASRTLATRLPRQAGQREERYMHLLGGSEVPADSGAEEEDAPVAPSRLEALEARVQALEERLARLEGTSD